MTSRLEMASGETTRGKAVLAHASLALRIALVLLLAAFTMAPGSCGGNPQTPKPAYPLSMLARDIIVAQGAFLKKAIEHHGAECRSGCTLASVKDPNLCVKLCNAIKAASDARELFIAGLDAYCAGPGWLEGTAPCNAQPANEAELRVRMEKFKSAVGEVRAQGGGQ